MREKKSRNQEISNEVDFPIFAHHQHTSYHLLDRLPLLPRGITICADIKWVMTNQEVLQVASAGRSGSLHIKEHHRFVDEGIWEVDGGLLKTRLSSVPAVSIMSLSSWRISTTGESKEDPRFKQIYQMWNHYLMSLHMYNDSIRHSKVPWLWILGAARLVVSTGVGSHNVFFKHSFLLLKCFEMRLLIPVPFCGFGNYADVPCWVCSNEF